MDVRDCPTCNHKPDIEDHSCEGEEHMWEVYCHHCQVSFEEGGFPWEPEHQPTIEQAVSLWNTACLDGGLLSWV